jgi:hypothetical protein
MTNIFCVSFMWLIPTPVAKMAKTKMTRALNQFLMRGCSTASPLITALQNPEFRAPRTSITQNFFTAGLHCLPKRHFEVPSFSQASKRKLNHSIFNGMKRKNCYPPTFGQEAWGTFQKAVKPFELSIGHYPKRLKRQRGTTDLSNPRTQDFITDSH